MKKIMLIGLLVLGVMLLIGVSYPKGATAGVNINVGINVPPPPPLLIPAPPPMFVIPGTYVYFAPEVDVDIFFYHGYWYRPHRGHWYRAGSYNGKWVYISPKRVPPVLLNLPPNFRRVPSGHRHVPHGELKKNWRRWEREKYWERHGGREWHGEKGEYNEGQSRGRGRHSD
jgi:hypothetical protein